MDRTAQLEAEYCPPLDTALFIAIVSDYDLSSKAGLTDAIATLDSLKESAALEEAAGFEPSSVGSYGTSYEIKDGQSRREHSLLNSDGLQSTETDTTSVSDGLSSLRLADNSPGPELEHHNLNNLDNQTKLQLLREVFSDQVSDHTIQSSLRKCKDNWNAAIEELLTQVFYVEAEDSDGGGRLAPKGIDGFSEERVSRTIKRKKNRRRRVSLSADPYASDASDISLDSQRSVPSKWQSTQADIDFITSHIQLPVSEVRIKYNQNGASIPQTINALLKEDIEKYADQGDDSQTRMLAQGLGSDFPTIAPQYLHALIRITRPSTSAAHELARALVTKPKGQHKDTVLVPQYIPVSIANIDGPTAQATAANTGANPPPSLMSAGSYAAARAQAFAQASAAHRKSKSDRAYGGVAAYYAQVARDLGGLSDAANASAMDALADQQSSPSQLDLHGVDVRNAIRIARAKVEQWWEALGENRVNGRRGADDRSMGYNIIVGRGSHSEGGKSLLGPAVTKMLKQEGWKIQDDGAIICVRGKLK